MSKIFYNPIFNDHVISTHINSIKYVIFLSFFVTLLFQLHIAKNTYNNIKSQLLDKYKDEKLLTDFLNDIFKIYDNQKISFVKLGIVNATLYLDSILDPSMKVYLTIATNYIEKMYIEKNKNIYYDIEKKLVLYYSQWSIIKIQIITNILKIHLIYDLCHIINDYNKDFNIESYSNDAITIMLNRLLNK